MAKNQKPKSVPQSGQEEDLVDMEQCCGTCGQKLYVPLTQARQVIQAVHSGTPALLICVCGAGNLLYRQQPLHD